MSRWLFLIIMLAASFLLNELDHALMVFQIRERMGVSPLLAMHLGALIDWFGAVLVAVTVVKTLGPTER